MSLIDDLTLLWPEPNAPAVHETALDHGLAPDLLLAARITRASALIASGWHETPAALLAGRVARGLACSLLAGDPDDAGQDEPPCPPFQ